jgi:hypothetical protein
MKDAPNCYKCIYRQGIAGDAHSACTNKNAIVKGDKYGIRSGWFFHPFNFDPTWLISCNGFESNEKN